MDIIEKELDSVDREILEYINKYEKDSFDDILESDTRVEVMLALSSVRKNIVSWYPFEKHCDILEIGADYGQITEFLCQCADNVVAYENNEEKREAILKRHSDISNLTVVDSLDGISGKFDYITLIGLEKISDDVQQIFNVIRGLLKPDGKLLIAMDNKFSVKRFSTSSEVEKLLCDFDKINSLDNVVEALRISGFKGQKVYYPVTDYRFTNAIFTDDVSFSKAELSRNIIYCNEDDIKFFEENEVLNMLLEENLDFKHCANSFFIEVFNGDFVDNEIRLVTFSNIRKSEYKIKTIMKNDFVYKYPYNEDSKNHIENVKKNIDIMVNSKLKTIDSYDGEKIISKYIKADTFDKVIINTAKADKNRAIELVKKFRQKLIDCLEVSKIEKNVFDKYDIKYDKEIINNMKFIKYGLWDLIFQNCFYIDNDFYFYDQEWLEENVSIDFILYRAIKYLSTIEKYVSKEELYEILDLNSNVEKIFDELDDKIQEEIRDKTMWKLNTQGKTILDLKREKLTDNHTINLLRIENSRKDVEIAKLKEELKKVYESNSWKITKPLRDLRRAEKKK